MLEMADPVRYRSGRLPGPKKYLTIQGFYEILETVVSREPCISCVQRCLVANYDRDPIDRNSLVPLPTGSHEVFTSSTLHKNAGWKQLASLPQIV
jgi:hypothetical protein